MLLIDKIICRARIVMSQNNFYYMSEELRSSSGAFFKEGWGEGGGIGATTGLKSESRSRQITVTVSCAQILGTRNDAIEAANFVCKSKTRFIQLYILCSIDILLVLFYYYFNKNSVFLSFRLPNNHK